MTRRQRRSRVRAAVAGGLSLALSACSGQFWANALTPRWGYDRHADIAYGDGPRQRLDVYVPQARADNAPVVVFFYGGSWQAGAKADYRFVAQALTSRGFVVVVPDYRIYPPTRFPGFVEDGAAAVAWTYAHARAYGGDADRVFLAGHSAGAHIAAMLATDPRYLAAEQTDAARLAGLIGIAGPYDFLPIKAATLKKIFAPESAWPASQPIRFVDGGEPPMLLMHGADDRTVAPDNSRNLAAAVNAAGGTAALKIYPDTGHSDILAPLAAPLRATGDELDDIAAFIEAGGA